MLSIQNQDNPDLQAASNELHEEADVVRECVEVLQDKGSEWSEGAMVACNELTPMLNQVTEVAGAGDEPADWIKQFVREEDWDDMVEYTTRGFSRTTSTARYQGGSGRELLSSYTALQDSSKCIASRTDIAEPQSCSPMISGGLPYNEIKRASETLTDLANTMNSCQALIVPVLQAHLADNPIETGILQAADTRMKSFINDTNSLADTAEETDTIDITKLEETWRKMNSVFTEFITLAGGGQLYNKVQFPLHNMGTTLQKYRAQVKTLQSLQQQFRQETAPETLYPATYLSANYNMSHITQPPMHEWGESSLGHGQSTIPTADSRFVRPNDQPFYR